MNSTLSILHREIFYSTECSAWLKLDDWRSFSSAGTNICHNWSQCSTRCSRRVCCPVVRCHYRTHLPHCWLVMRVYYDVHVLIDIFCNSRVLDGRWAICGKGIHCIFRALIKYLIIYMSIIGVSRCRLFVYSVHLLFKDEWMSMRCCRHEITYLCWRAVKQHLNESLLCRGALYILPFVVFCRSNVETCTFLFASVSLYKSTALNVRIAPHLGNLVIGISVSYN